MDVEDDALLQQTVQILAHLTLHVRNRHMPRDNKPSFISLRSFVLPSRGHAYDSAIQLRSEGPVQSRWTGITSEEIESKLYDINIPVINYHAVISPTI